MANSFLHTSFFVLGLAACSSAGSGDADPSQPSAAGGSALGPSGSSCQIVVPSCPKHRELGGVLTDWDAPSNADQQICLSRANVFQAFCSESIPVSVTANFIDHGAVTGSRAAASAANGYANSDTTTYYTDLPSFPAATSLVPTIATASTTYDGSPASNVIAYSTPGSTWNSGLSPSAKSPSWILLDFGVAQPISSLQLIVNQVPGGPAHHRIWVGNSPNALSQALDFSGSFTNGEVITVHLADTTPAARYVKVETLTTNSWASWGHITAFPTHAPHYSGFYDSAKTSEFTDATPSVKAFATTSWVDGADVATDVALLQEARDANMSAMLVVDPIFFGGSLLLPESQYQANWDAMAAQIAPFMADGTIVSLYTIDEPYLAVTRDHALTYDQMRVQLETVATVIKASFPNAKVSTLLTLADPPVLAQQNIIPKNYDWIGFDYYGTWTPDHDIPWYIGQIESHLYPGQQILLFPDTSVYFPEGSPLGFDAYWINQDVVRLHNYFQLAQTDPNIVGTFGFMYQSYNLDCAADGTSCHTWLGASDPYMTSVLGTWRSFSSGVMVR